MTAAAPNLLVGIEAVRAAARTLEGVAVRTPLVEVPALAAVIGVPVLLKCEQLQPIGAFKIRGAYNAVSRVAAGGAARGVVTQSSGNHGQAVAYAGAHSACGRWWSCRRPRHRSRSMGCGATAARWSLRGPPGRPSSSCGPRRSPAEEGLVMIPPYDHPDVIAGQGTIGLEILEQRPDVHTILVR